MPTIAILKYPDKRLGTKATPVTDFNDKALQNIVDDMLETLHNTNNCAGLAATQLDIINPQRITVIYDYREQQPTKETALCLINPEIIAREGESNDPEGCMSITGGIYEPVSRSARVLVKAFNRHGELFEIEGEGFMAKLMQHEIDHLNGIIFIDHFSKLKRQRVDKKFFKFKRWAKNQ
jgi:peptide deformylase